MKVKEEQKRKQKEDLARYEALHDKDMASYLGGNPNPQPSAAANAGVGAPLDSQPPPQVSSYQPS